MKKAWCVPCPSEARCVCTRTIDMTTLMFVSTVYPTQQPAQITAALGVLVTEAVQARDSNELPGLLSLLNGLTGCLQTSALHGPSGIDGIGFRKAFKSQSDALHKQLG